MVNLENKILIFICAFAVYRILITRGRISAEILSQALRCPMSGISSNRRTGQSGSPIDHASRPDQRGFCAGTKNEGI
jgi:hypothetical protein